MCKNDRVNVFFSQDLGKISGRKDHVIESLPGYQVHGSFDGTAHASI